MPAKAGSCWRVSAMAGCSRAIPTARDGLVRKEAGLPSTVGLHTLRHSAACVLPTDGVPLKVVYEIFGHSSIATTGDI